MCNVPTIDMTGTGRNIVKLRQNAGFSVKDLQDIFGFATPNAIYKWQKGMAMPTVDNLIILAAIFGVRGQAPPSPGGRKLGVDLE